MSKEQTQLLSPSELLYRGFAINPQAIAAQDDREEISYQELQTRCEALANALRDLAPAHSRIGLSAQNHIDHLVSFLAIILSGHTWVPINPNNGAELNRVLLGKSQPALLLLDRYSESCVGEYSGPRIILREATDTNPGASHEHNAQALMEQYRGRDFELNLPDMESVFGIKFTGGTTGEPKGVMQSHRNVAAVIENMQALFQFTKNDGNLAVAPLTHGGSHYIFPLLAVGGKQVLLPKAEPEKIAEAFSKHGATVSFMPPTLIYKLMDNEGLKPQQFDNLRHLTYSASPMPAERIRQAIEYFGPKLSTVYGQTEAPMTITAMSAEDMSQEALQASVGKHCPFSKVAILNKQGETLAPGETGEIAAAGDIVMSGYYNDPEKTQETIVNGWLLTGDLGYLDENGYLFLQGRAKELIITGGFNVYPAEVENALAKIDAIAEACVFSYPDDYWGERLEAAICLKPGTDINDEQLTTQLKDLLGAVKTPKKFHRLEQLPRNPVGKVVRREVKQAVEDKAC